jgi:hypothetical protein
MGQPEWQHASTAMAKLAQEHCLLVNAPFTCPISEALGQAIGASTDNIIWIDESVPINLQEVLGVTDVQKVFAMICTQCRNYTPD